MQDNDTNPYSGVNWNFINSELNLALTLLDTSNITGAEERQRCRMMAQDDYATISRIIKGLPKDTPSGFSPSEYARIQRKLLVVRRLRAAGLLISS